MSEDILQTPGDVRINKLYIIRADGTNFSILDYLVELNLYESIFSPTMTGSITLGDSRNLIKSFPILGEELLLMEITTPGTNISIEKIFRINALVEKNYVTDGASQIYTLQFASLELFRDINNPMYRSFSGTPSDIVIQIFEKYLKVPRSLSIINNNKNLVTDSSYTPFIIFSSTNNTVKFVSPGWTPIQCINWLCSHAEPAGNKSADFLFWESNKSFYLGTIEDIFSIKERVNAGTYYYSASLMNSEESTGTKMMAIRDISFKRLFDQLENKMDGFLSSRVTNVNLINKTYENYDYDYTNNFLNYKHLESVNPVPLHSPDTSRNPQSHTVLNYSIPGLYSSVASNYSERYKFIYGNRRSNILKLNNLSIKAVVPGRSDIEAGSVVNLILPRGFPNSPEEKSESMKDELYSGNYLVTSINHKINPISHFITMDLTKDSLSVAGESS